MTPSCSGLIIAEMIKGENSFQNYSLTGSTMPVNQGAGNDVHEAKLLSD